MSDMTTHITCPKCRLTLAMTTEQATLDMYQCSFCGHAIDLEYEMHFQGDLGKVRTQNLPRTYAAAEPRRQCAAVDMKPGDSMRVYGKAGRRVTAFDMYFQEDGSFRLEPIARASRVIGCTVGNVVTVVNGDRSVTSDAANQKGPVR